MNKLRTNIAFLIVGLLIGGLVYTVHADTQSVPAPFDHSNCQYPNRLSNPPNGCDNSDPACGEMAKGADHCFADEPVAKPTMPEAPVSSTPDHTSTPIQPVNQCGGK